MSLLPRRLTYDLGRDQFGRLLEATVERGKIMLRRHAANQRDEEVWLEITAAQAKAIGEIP